MNLSIGIVGLPNVGKSTLFNALLKKQQAFAANFPFATIEPNAGVVPVPDTRLLKLAELIKQSEDLEHLPPQVPSTVAKVWAINSSPASGKQTPSATSSETSKTKISFVKDPRIRKKILR